MRDELLTPMDEAAEAVHAWAVAGAENGGTAPLSLELPGAARDMADLLEVRAEAVLIAKAIEGPTDELASRGADGVYVVPALLEELRAQRT